MSDITRLEHSRDNAVREAEFHAERVRSLPHSVAFLDLLTGAFIGLGAGVLGNLLTYEWQPKQYFVPGMTVGAAVLSFVFAGICWYICRPKSAELARVLRYTPSQLYFELDDIKDDYALVAQEVLYRASWTVFNEVVNERVYQFVDWTEDLLSSKQSQRGRSEAERLADVRRSFDTLLKLVVDDLAKNRKEILGYTAEEIYFFDIFELQNDRELHVIARCRSERDAQGRPVNDHFRSWRIGEGDVGMAALLAKPVYGPTENSENHSKTKDTDPNYFASRIVAPIPAVNRRPHNVAGALCINSSLPSRLQREHTSLLANLAFSLAPAFFVKNIAERKLHGNQVYKNYVS
jgi:hypothetical protein